MIYSVYNYGTRSYDYYHGGQSASSAHAPVPTRARRTTLGPRGRGLGATPEQAAWKLPAGARKIGSGYEARGLIATDGIVGDATTGFEVVGLAILAFTLYKVLG